MDNKVLEGLYIGDLSTSKNEDFLLRNSITHVLSMLTESLPHFQNVTYLCLDISDSPQQRIVPVFGECLEFIHRARAGGGSVLVHCSTGVSRCPTIAAVYILARTKLSIEEAFQAISVVRQCINPNYGFRRQLEDWSKQHRKKAAECMQTWPVVQHDDQQRCSYLLAVSNSDKPAELDANSNCRGSEIEVKQKSNSTAHTDDENSEADSSATLSKHSDSNCLSPIIMGNNSSTSVGYVEPEVKKHSNTSRLERFRSAFRQSPNKKSKEHEKKHRETQDTTNNNKVDAGSPNGLHYTDNITRSTTLPNNIHKTSINGSPLNGSTLQTRLLPAYKSEEAGIIGNIKNRQRIISSPGYSPHHRRDSQSSSYSHRYNTFNRVSATHIPAHLDKRLVRSRSVGVIPAAELRMRRAASASVVKLADCEDWVV